MKDNYDFSKGVRKNPYLEKMKNGYSVTVHYKFGESPSDGEAADTKESEMESESSSAPGA